MRTFYVNIVHSMRFWYLLVRRLHSLGFYNHQDHEVDNLSTEAEAFYGAESRHRHEDGASDEELKDRGTIVRLHEI